MLGLNRTTNDNANTVDMIVLDTPFENNTESQVTAAIDRLGEQNNDAQFRNPPHGIAFCIKGSYGETAEIVVGANSSQLDVRVMPANRIDPGCTI